MDMVRWAMVVGLMFVMGCAPAPSAVPTQEPRPAPPRDTEEAGGVRLTFVNAWQTPSDGKMALTVLVSIANQGTRPVVYGPLAFSLLDDAGHQFPSASPFGANPPLLSGTLQPGDKAEGTVGFSGTPRSSALLLRFEGAGLPQRLTLHLTTPA